MAELKPKEKLILEYISDTLQKKGYAPSVRDICAALNVKSTSTVHMYLARLSEKGFLQKEPGKSRTLRVELPGDKNRHYKVPIIGLVAAGTPILTVENYDGFMDYSTKKSYDKNTLFALEIKGDSMIKAGILNGDYVIVEQRDYAENGEIVVAMVDDSATVKRFYKENGHFRLQPENPAMEPIITREVSILGKVVALARYY